MYPVRITSWGTGLNNKFGITGVMDATLSLDEICSQFVRHANREDGRAYCTIVSLDGRQDVIDRIRQQVLANRQTI